MNKCRYIIISYDGGYREYVAVDVLEALDQYVTYCGINDMTIKLDMWHKIKTALPKIEERIELINQLVDDINYRINIIIGNYTYLYGDVLTPVENEN